LWTLPQKIRDIIGIGNDEILSDRQIEEQIRVAQEQVKEELFTFHWGETVEGNPDTGASWDGVNTKYQTSSYPIMDSNFDMLVNDSDVTGYWVDETYVPQVLSITVSSPTFGILTITQSDGSTPIPSSAEDIVVEYYSYHRSITPLQLENLTTFLSCYFVITTLKAGTSVSMVDLMKNEKIVLSDPNVYLFKYQRLLNSFQKNVITGV